MIIIEYILMFIVSLICIIAFIAIGIAYILPFIQYALEILGIRKMK